MRRRHSARKCKFGVAKRGPRKGHCLKRRRARRAR